MIIIIIKKKFQPQYTKILCKSKCMQMLKNLRDRSVLRTLTKKQKYNLKFDWVRFDSKFF